MSRTLLLSIALSAASPGAASDHLRAAQAGALSPAARVEDLRGMVGHREGEGLGGEGYETISPPVAGQMAGHFQQVRDGKLAFHELSRFVPAGQSVILRIKHFGPDLTGREERGEAAEFPLVALSPDGAYFDGLPLRRIGEDRLETIVRIQKADGSGREESFRFRRMPR